MKKLIKNIIVIIFVILVLWIPISTFIQAIIKPELTQMQLLFRVPKSYICQFEE